MQITLLKVDCIEVQMHKWVFTEYSSTSCVEGDIFWTISEENFFSSSYFKAAIINLQLQGNYPTYFPCVGIHQSHCRNKRLKEMTSSHQVLVPAVSSSHIIDFHGINGTWCVSKVVRRFFALQLHTEQLLQMITSLMVRNAVIQANLQLILCVDIF